MTGRFWNDERGAVTIDWVGLTAGILLLGIAVVYAIFNQGVDDAADDISAELAALPIASIGAAPSINDGGGGEQDNSGDPPTEEPQEEPVTDRGNEGIEDCAGGICWVDDNNNGVRDPDEDVGFDNDKDGTWESDEDGYSDFYDKT